MPKVRRTSRLPAPRVARRVEGGTTVRRLVGYAAVFFRPTDAGTEYQLPCPWDDLIIERLMPSCFDESLRRRDDCLCTFNHNCDFLLGRTASGTCRLSKDSVGLKYEVDLPEGSPLAESVAAAVRRGDCRGSSFTFEYEDVNWREISGEQPMVIIEVLSVRLYDVSAVARPAYRATSVSFIETAARSASRHQRPRDILPISRDARAKLMRARVVSLGI